MSSVSMIDGHIDKMTNFERIKSMSIDEMAEFIYEHCCCDDCSLPTSCLDKNCKKCVKKWLESEVDTE